MGFVVGSLDDFRAFGIKGEKIGRGFLGDNTSSEVLEDLQNLYTSSCSLALTLSSPHLALAQAQLVHLTHRHASSMLSCPSWTAAYAVEALQLISPLYISSTLDVN